MGLFYSQIFRQSLLIKIQLKCHFSCPSSSSFFSSLFLSVLTSHLSNPPPPTNRRLPFITQWSLWIRGGIDLHRMSIVQLHLRSHKGSFLENPHNQPRCVERHYLRAWSPINEFHCQEEHGK